MGTVAKSVVFKVGTVGVPGTGTDISVKLTNVKPSYSVDKLDGTTFGTSGAKANLAGLTEFTISVEGNWDAAINTHMMGLLGQDNSGAGMVFEHGPQGSTTGNVKVTGNIILTKYDPPSQVGAVNKFTAEFASVGAATVATY